MAINPLFGAPSSLMAQLATFFHGHDWCSQGFLGLPFKNHKATPEGDHWYPRLLAPFGYRKIFTLVKKSTIVAAIKRLSAFSGPANIAGFIITLVVNAIQGRSSRADSKIGYEAFKSKERQMDLYSFGSIVLVHSIFWVVATGFHVAPRNIFLSVFDSDGASRHAYILSGLR